MPATGSGLSFRAEGPVFNANVEVGDRRNRPSPARTPADQLAETDRHGESRALVYHAPGQQVLVDPRS